MYRRLLIVVVAIAAVAYFMLITNLIATAFMVLGTYIAARLNYSYSKDVAGETAPKYRRNLFRKWRWYACEFRCLGWILFFTLCSMAIGWVLYYVEDYSVNIGGLVGSLIVLIVISFAAHFLGTKHGFLE